MNKKIILAVLLWQGTAQGMDLPEFLQAVQQRHKTLQSLDASIDAASDRREAGDLELSPVLRANASYSDDKRAPNQLFQFGVTETKTTQYSLGLDKKFSSGTAVGLSASAVETENPGMIPLTSIPGISPAQANSLYLAKSGVGSLGFSISQSLWRDAFGRATRLRRDRENEVAAAEKGQFNLQKKQILIQAENTYWDYVIAQENKRISESSFERSRKIESWTERRARDGISDRADLLQTQALVAQRQLQLQMAENDLMAAQKAIRDLLETPAAEPLPRLEGNIAQIRDLKSQVQGKGRVVQLEAYLTALQARSKAASSREVDDSYKPDITLQGSYRTNSYEPNLGRAVNTWTETDKPTATIGLQMVYQFDTDAKGAAQGVARKEALAAKLLSERKLMESESSWTELQRLNQDLKAQIESAEKISSLQLKRAKAQIDKFNKGRSLTTDVVQAEQDAAEAELSLTRLRSTQRKLEAQAQLFIGIEETL